MSLCSGVFMSVCCGVKASHSWFTPAAVLRAYLAYCMTDNHFTAASALDEQ